jgi:hypothetical protein
VSGNVDGQFLVAVANFREVSDHLTNALFADCEVGGYQAGHRAPTRADDAKIERY